MDPELQKLYSPSLWNQRMPPEEVVLAHGKFLAKNSESARKNLKSFSYKFSDSDPEQSIEIFYKDNDFEIIDGKYLNFKAGKIFIYIHGGYWQWGSVKDSSFMAENMAEKNVITIAVGYTIAPQATMSEIVSQVERAVAKVLEYSGESEVYICGHSAGGHLASILLFTNFEQKFNVSSKNLKGLIPVSGIFDLRPLLKTDVNDNLKMVLEESTILSPMLLKESHLNKETKFLIAYAQNDSPAFHAQSEDFKNYISNELGYKNVRTEKIDCSDHFDVIENISQNEFILTKKIFEFMKA
ncbi:unnamed protein product [Brachionus calyciflorus]|uniref:BD-FAE-like domain-containing protein n=1 Tax=Brachionus calyciflorus TaxID=104777 RepID=A0A813SRS1_9BILA|nr:unnamed protein product [Brachionus calyciflorus]